MKFSSTESPLKIGLPLIDLKINLFRMFAFAADLTKSDSLGDGKPAVPWASPAPFPESWQAI
jgi:hypothetical protein